MFVAFKLQQTKVFIIIYFNDFNYITKNYNIIFFLLIPTTIFIIEKVV